MLSPKSLFLLLSINILINCEEEGIKSKASAHNSKWKRCPYSLKKIWHVEVSSFPFSAPPLVTDVDGDGGLDVVVAPFAETVAVIDGETGKHLHGSNWPQQNLDKSVFSSPLQFDIDGDGTLDILIITSAGEGLFYSKMGIALPDFTFELPPAYVHASWFEEKLVAYHDSVLQFVFAHKVPGHVAVDPHVLSTPVLQGMRYLILGVSFYYNSEDYSDEIKEKPWGKENIKDKFYLTAVSVLDLLEFRSSRLKKAADNSDLSYLKTFYLELHQTPVFGLFTPTVCDLDGDFSEVEIVHGSSSGSLYVIGMTSGRHRHGFPKEFGSISGRVSAVDTDGNGILELYVLNTSGSISRVDSKSGEIQWTNEMEGSSFSGSHAFDVDSDGHLDIVMATNRGDVYAFHGVNGSVMPNYPFKTGSSISAHVLATKFMKRGGTFDMVFLSDIGVLYIVASDQSCVTRVSIDDKSLVDIVSNDIVLMNQGMEFLVATSDGSVICLGSGQEAPVDELVEKSLRLSHHNLISPRDAMSRNDFSSFFQKASIFIEDSTRALKEVTGRSFYMEFSVHHLPLDSKYNIRVYLGSDVVYLIDQIKSSSIPKWLEIQTPDEPGEGLVTLVLTDQHGFAYSDCVFLRFNQLILLDLQWLVVTPFIAMVIILLVNHGFPAKDLLPVTFPFKAR